MVNLIYLDPPFNSKRDYNFPAFHPRARLRLICPVSAHLKFAPVA